MTPGFTRGREAYLKLPEYAELRSDELRKLLKPYTELTDRYGSMICEIVLALGKLPATSIVDVVRRDLTADTFDFLYEARALILKGKLEVAYPLARRAYESLSLMVACELDSALAVKWAAGKQISNGEVRKILESHPKGEPEHQTKEFYRFFSANSHPNRDTMAHRLLGDGNEFTLGAIGVPSLVLLADYALRTLELWYWFGAFLGSVYLNIMSDQTPDFGRAYLAVSREAPKIKSWLIEQHNRALEEERVYMEEVRRETNSPQ